MRYFFPILILLLGACSAPKQETPAASPQSKMNILFVSIDDLRPTLGVYDDAFVKSPNIDALANLGYVFRNTYCQAAVCAPSRASLMTGLRPDSNHVWHLGDKFRELNPSIVTIPQHFKKNGYHTVCIGKIFHNYMPDSVSWDEPDLRPRQYLKPAWLKRDGETFYVNEKTQNRQKRKRDSLIELRPNYYADGWNNGPAWESEDVHDTLYFDGAQAELAKRTLKRLSKSKEPFFLALGFFRPHLPFAAPKAYWDLYDRNELPLAPNDFLPDGSPIFSSNSMYELRGYDGFKHLKHPSVSSISEDTARTLKHGYYASVSYVDAQLGKVVAALKEYQLDKNTIIIVWGDHGWKLGEHNSWCKQTNFDIDIHVPLIVYDPRSENGGAQISGITELIDMYPSMCEMAGIEIPKYLQGTSFVPLLKDPERAWKKAAFSQFHRRPKVTPDGGRYMGYSMRTATHHYIEWYQWNPELGERGDLMGTELYDNEIDPQENKNVAMSAEYDSLRQSLSTQLRAGWKANIPE
jgi:iduronate 2-sulfatase